MKLGEIPGASKEVQDAFVAMYSRSEEDKRIVPEALFIASRQNDQVYRTYHSVGPNGFARGNLVYHALGTSPFAFAIDALTSFKTGLDSSILVVKQLTEDKDGVIELPNADGASLDLRISNSGNTFTASYLTDNTDDSYELEQVSIESIDDPEISFNSETGVWEVRFLDNLVEVKNKTPLKGIYNEYLSLCLRQDPFNAELDLDVWARADWMRDFGVTWRKTVDVSIFQT